MGDFVEKNKKLILAAIIILAAVLIFTGLTRADMQHDDATYSFRAVGYLDYMNTATNQTTPIQWFDEIPWWGNLSFHDHPPLVFLIQYIFFSIFGVSLFIARLPFALAGLGSVVALYFLTRNLYNQNIALMATSLLAILSYHSWASKIGYLEPIATLLILLTLLFYVKGLKNSIYFIGFGTFLGLALLTKHTVWFIIPAIALHLIIKHRRLIFNKRLIFGSVLALIIFSPVLVYNYQMYQSRGHFDVQLSILFDQPKDDWPGLGRGVDGFKAVDLWRTFYKSYSILIFISFVISLVYLLFIYFRDIKKQNNLLLILLFLFALIQFGFTGGPPRFLSLLNPMIVLIVSVGIYNIYSKLGSTLFDVKFKRLGLIVILLLTFSFEFFYNINTNILTKPLGEQGKHFSMHRWEAGGFERLENYLLQNNVISRDKINNIEVLSDAITSKDEVEGRDIIVFDTDLNWFSTLWYFSRYNIYHDSAFFVSVAELSNAIGDNELLAALESLGVRDFYFIRGKKNHLFISDAHKESSVILEDAFKSVNAEEQKIFNNNNELAFVVYRIKIN